MTALLTCPKRPHDNPLGGYLHAADDDSPYDVDGTSYCGRCHYLCDASGQCGRPIPSSTPASEGTPCATPEDREEATLALEARDPVSTWHVDSLASLLLAFADDETIPTVGEVMREAAKRLRAAPRTPDALVSETPDESRSRVMAIVREIIGKAVADHYFDSGEREQFVERLLVASQQAVTKQRIAELLRLPWTIRVEHDPVDGHMTARVAEIPDAIATGMTDKELSVDLWESLTASLLCRLEFGDPIPVPQASGPAAVTASSVRSVHAFARPSNAGAGGGTEQLTDERAAMLGAPMTRFERNALVEFTGKEHCYECRQVRGDLCSGCACKLRYEATLVYHESHDASALTISGLQARNAELEAKGEITADDVERWMDNSGYASVERGGEGIVTLYDYDGEPGLTFSKGTLVAACALADQFMREVDGADDVGPEESERQVKAWLEAHDPRNPALDESLTISPAEEIAALEAERDGKAFDMREVAAQVCESRARSLGDGGQHSAANEARKCAAAIRAEGAPSAVSKEFWDSVNRRRELEADKADLDWLEERAVSIERDYDDHQQYEVHEIVGSVNDREWIKRGQGETVRLAIRDARSTTGK